MFSIWMSTKFSVFFILHEWPKVNCSSVWDAQGNIFSPNDHKKETWRQFVYMKYSILSIAQMAVEY